MKDYRILLHDTIGGGKTPPECIAIRTNEWKLILRARNELLENISWWNFISGQKFPVDPVELYNLGDDPMEQKNVAKDHPEIVAKLKAKLLEWDAANKKPAARTKEQRLPLIIPYP